MSEVVCHYLEAVPRIRRSLRRFRRGDEKCPKPLGGFDYCNAENYLDEIDHPVKTVIQAFDFPHDDPRWPTVCPGCGAAFADTDRWQVFVDALYKRTDTGETVVFREAQPGAMWDAWWMPDNYRGPDGLALVLKLPGGHTWMIDGASSSGGKWTRSGTPPKITASPSILVPGSYHGWLRDGVLVEC